MSVKTQKAREVLERISLSLKHSIADKNEAQDAQLRKVQKEISKQNVEIAKNTAIFMSSMRVY